MRDALAFHRRGCAPMACRSRPRAPGPRW